jgi:hypothetical protein
MSDPTKRIARWNAKFNTERIKATLDDLRPDMLQSVSGVFPQLADMESQVKQVLDGLGLPTVQYPFYLAFGRELFRLGRQGVSGESVAIEAQVLLDKWVARGLVQSALEKVRKDVFNIVAPVAP